MNNEDKYGLVPDLDWININSLTIDDTYQRDTLSKRSQQNIKKIKEAFAWSKFSPLTVADLGNNKYSIIDGQHRYIAAKELGDITDLPCWIIPQCQTKSQADALFQELGLNMTTAFNIFLRQAVREGRIPFNVTK